MSDSIQLPPLFGCSVRHCHLVGVGGAGMTPLAMLLAQRGWSVSGEDDAITAPAQRWLDQAGVALGPVGLVPPQTQLLVYSSAIAPAHPARVVATQLGLPQVRRGELLAELLRDRKLIAIVGAHGKTTTTGLLITALRRAGFEAGWLLGGLFQDDSVPPAAIDHNGWVVAEIDESDGTIDRFSPEITVATNLDWDHPDYYRQIGDLEATFAALFSRTRSDIYINPACALSARLAGRGFTAPVHRFGFEGEFAVRIVGMMDGRQVLDLSPAFGASSARVRAGGDFNALNAAAALAVCVRLGVAVTPDLLAHYPGVKRRQVVMLESARLQVIEDYAHHPTEIAALIGGMRRLPHKRLLVAFQPHRFSRTARFKADFARALLGADELFLLDVYAASEQPIAGGTTADIYAEIARSGPGTRVHYLPGDRPGFLRLLRERVREGDLVLFVGAGDIDQSAAEFVRDLQGDVAVEERWGECVRALQGVLSPETKLLENEPIGPKTTMRVGGPARYYAEPANEADLCALLRETRLRALPVLILGRGSNLLVPDEGVAALVLRLAGREWQRFDVRPDGRVEAGAGLRLKELCGLAAARGLRGFEFLEGIPGTLGGALRMNAGAMGGWMFDLVEAVRLVLLDGTVRTLRRHELHVAYRDCRELGDSIALGALLRPVSAGVPTADIQAQIAAFQVRRLATQPRDPSAGCMFKNPPNDSAGRLIDALGLKGERVGDAEVSAVHANFIVNRGQATAADVIALMRRVRERVKAAHGIELEPEVLLYGRDWRDVL
jgi:UDP-N-acetylmuramate--L-alanine ligase/UDP-N-acetylenolpyruvoylglucosamine reductase